MVGSGGDQALDVESALASDGCNMQEIQDELT